MSQSSNDTFPTAMHIAAVKIIEKSVLPAIDTLCKTFSRLEKENEGIVKSGRTHLQDATPIKFSQEISGWRTSLEKDRRLLESAVTELREIALVKMKRGHRHSQLAALTHNPNNVMGTEPGPVAAVDELRPCSDEVYPVAAIQFIPITFIGELRASAQ